MSEQIVTKKCSKCKQIKLLSEFYKDKRHKDGHFSNCKICHSKEVKKYRQTEQGKCMHRKESIRYQNSKKGKGTRKHWQQTERGKTVQKDGRRRYRIRHPECWKAVDAVNHAIDNGKLPRPDTLQCSCGEQAKQYHHPSYAPKHRLNVMPICKICHKKIHLRSYASA